MPRMAAGPTHFQQLASLQLEGVKIEKFRSQRTGLTVCVAGVPGPIVKGFLCVATEAHDDDGLPHTLEHLVFMGSEQYPYKGVLDLLANRCFAQGTNAWTDVDHTCYTMTTAGSQGFLHLLPVFLDHLLYPTLRDEAYVTEVHHVTGEAEDAGVVYCEMQARENTAEDLSERVMLRKMYPGYCGYKANTGGSVECIRSSCSNEKVRRYHSSFYRPDNLSVIVVGQVSSDDLFAVLTPFEDRIVSKGSLPQYERPWQSPVPALVSSSEEHIQFPTDDESCGSVLLAWRGPQATDLRLQMAMDILWLYLTETPVAPLQRDLVEIDDPLCSSIEYSFVENSEGCMRIEAANVPTEELNNVYAAMSGVLQRIVDGQEKLNLDRMRALIHREVLEELDKLEDSPHDTIAHAFIGDFLYSQSVADLNDRMNSVQLRRSLVDEGSDFWCGLLKRFCTERPHILVICEPSAKLAEAHAAEEKERVSLQRQRLGEDGLLEKKQILDDAQQKNEVEAPSSMLSSLAVPSIDGIHFHSVQTFTNHPQSQSTGHPSPFALDQLPILVEFDDVSSSFVKVSAVIDTSGLPDDLRYYLPLFLEVMFKSSVVRNGKTVSHENVIMQLERDLFDHGVSFGVTGDTFEAGTLPQLVTVYVQAELSKFALAVGWLRDLLLNVNFTKARLRSVAKKLGKEITELKRCGRKVSWVVSQHLRFSKQSNRCALSIFAQQGFLKRVLKRLEKDSAGVSSELEQLREAITRPQNLTLHVVANANKLSAACNPLSVLLDFSSAVASKSGAGASSMAVAQMPTYSSKLLRSLVDDASASGALAGHSAVIASVGAVESGFLVQACHGVADFCHSDVAALKVLTEYLVAMEGPLWRELRGQGLSYDYDIYASIEEGLLYFFLSECTNVVAAYERSRELIGKFISGEEKFNVLKVEAAVSSVCFAIINREDSVSDAAAQSFLAYLRGVPRDYNRRMLADVMKVTADDLRRVCCAFFKPLFDPSQSSCVICCNPGKVEEISSGLAKLGVDLFRLSGLDKVCC